MSILRQFASSALRTSRNGKTVCSVCRRRAYSKKIVQENDIVLLRHVTNSTSEPVLTSRLGAGKKTTVSRDFINHDDILGKGVRDMVWSKKRIGYRVLEPTLAEYTDLSPRIVTPIYSQDAIFIVSLLDLNPTVPNLNRLDQERIEIFEAGTGHGALTLHLARAIHAANTALPNVQDDDEARQQETNPGETYTQWRANRRAVIHTLDISARHSAHAETVVKNFRHGMYYPHIDFHVGTIEEYLSSRLEAGSNLPFLDHAILDLPATHDYLELVSKALKPNGSLITFCPSITQINSGFTFARSNNVPLFLDKVVEIGIAVGVGGREWDVRFVKPRAVVKAQAEAEKESAAASEAGHSVVVDGEDGALDPSIGVEHQASTSTPSSAGWEMICRPKVGLRTSGGGFVGLWRKMTE